MQFSSRPLTVGELDSEYKIPPSPSKDVLTTAYQEAERLRAGLATKELAENHKSVLERLLACEARVIRVLREIAGRLEAVAVLSDGFDSEDYDASLQVLKQHTEQVVVSLRSLRLALVSFLLTNNVEGLSSALETMDDLLSVIRG